MKSLMRLLDLLGFLFAKAYTNTETQSFFLPKFSLFGSEVQALGLRSVRLEGESNFVSCVRACVRTVLLVRTVPARKGVLGTFLFLFGLASVRPQLLISEFIQSCFLSL